MVSVTVVETDTGDEGLAYVRTRLAGGLTLSSNVLARVDLDHGFVFTWATDPPPATLVDFEHGSKGLIHGGVANAHVLALIRDFFLRNPFGSLWAEELLPKRSDPFWTNPEIPEEERIGWFFGDEVYSLAFPGDDDDHVLGTLDNVFSWGGGAFLTASGAAALYRRGREIQAADVGEVASQISFIICPAYDSMGYLVWRRTA